METLAAQKFVPALPTLWPGMLLGRPRQTEAVPFAAPNARYFYFARNAVWLAVKMLGLEGGEVLVPAYHHGVEVEALIDAGAKVRFYRVDARWRVDVADLARRIGPATRAVYLIHYAGFPGPVEALRALCDERGLPLIEDCALSLLSSDGSVPLGGTGDVAVFCLYKTLPVPNGGAMVINGPRPLSVPELPAPSGWSTASHALSSMLQNLELRAGVLGHWVRSAVRNVGRGTARAASLERVATGTQHFRREHVDLGISPLSLKIARSLDLRGVVEARRRNYFYLLAQLRGMATPVVSELRPGVCPLFFPIRVGDKAEVMARLKLWGVETVDFWRHFHPECPEAEFPEVAELRNTVLEVPCHQDLGPEQMAHVVAAVRDALAADRRAPRARARG